MSEARTGLQFAPVPEIALDRGAAGSRWMTSSKWVLGSAVIPWVLFSGDESFMVLGFYVASWWAILAAAVVSLLAGHIHAASTRGSRARSLSAAVGVVSGLAAAAAAVWGLFQLSSLGLLTGLEVTVGPGPLVAFIAAAFSTAAAIKAFVHER